MCGRLFLESELRDQEWTFVFVHVCFRLILCWEWSLVVSTSMLWPLDMATVLALVFYSANVGVKTAAEGV